MTHDSMKQKLKKSHSFRVLQKERLNKNNNKNLEYN